MNQAKVFYDFKPEMGFPLRVIHPLQHRFVTGLLQQELPENIREIRIFGGSLELYCSEHSDLDLYVILHNSATHKDEENVRKFFDALQYTINKACDVLVVDELDAIEWSQEKYSVDWVARYEGVMIYGAK